MHSKHRIDFPSEAIEGTYSTGTIHTDIYFEREMPSAEELSFYKSSFLIVGKNAQLEVYYVDQTGHAEKADVPEEVRQKMSKAVNDEIKRMGVSDFYVLDKSAIKSREDLVEILQADRRSDESKSAFILQNGLIYYVNKLDPLKVHLLNKERMSEAEVLSLCHDFNIGTKDFISDTIARKELTEKQTQTLVGMTEKNKRELIVPVNVKTPIDRYFSKASMQVIQSALSPHMQQGKKPYYLYEAELDSSLYRPNTGDFIKDFETLAEMDAKEVSEKVGDLFSKKLFNPEWLGGVADKAKREVGKKLSQPTTYVNALTSLLAMANPHAKSDPDAVMMDQEKRVRESNKRVYEKKIVEPREGRAFQLQGEVPVRNMKAKNIEYYFEHIRLGSIEESEQHRKMKVWIVSDVDPALVASRKGVHETLGRSFVCATEDDARELAKMISQNRAECDRLLAAEPLKLHAFSGNKVHDVVLKNVLNTIDSGFNDQIGAYSALINRQRDYIRDYNSIDEYSAAPEIPVEEKRNRHLAYKDYPHFQKILQVQEQMIAVRSYIDECRGDLSKVDISTLNKELKTLYDLCQKYVKEHPYKNSNNDPVFNLLNNVEKLKAKMVELMEKVKGQHEPSPATAKEDKTTPRLS